MILYRFAQERYGHDLSGNGARLYGGRWNPPGIPVVYTSSSISLALLELIANSGSLEYLQHMHLIELQVPDELAKNPHRFDQLKKNWYQDLDYTRWMGKKMLQTAQSLLCACPSVIVPQEWNYLVNPMHADIRKLSIRKTQHFHFDERLFRKTNTTIALQS
ncbi:MAG TPA: RES family NAD+ phosphorylase [Sediminibacterium sp.]|nr:RES family NAD+ phosphorylase [Sediminibacterium sp.]